MLVPDILVIAAHLLSQRSISSWLRTFAPQMPRCHVPLTAAQPLQPRKTRRFRPSPPQKWLHSSVTPERQSENLGFSTFFSTTVENFGGRPYGRPFGSRREATVT